jgi:hypothetical protein
MIQNRFWLLIQGRRLNHLEILMDIRCSDLVRLASIIFSLIIGFFKNVGNTVVAHSAAALRFALYFYNRVWGRDITIGTTRYLTLSLIRKF